MEGFKVLDAYEGELWSRIQVQGDGAVQYKEEEWTERLAGNGPLAVFVSYGDALNFVASIAGVPFSRIYACVFDKSADAGLWYIGRQTGKRITSPCVPTGTEFADRVKITKLIYGRGAR